MHTTRRTFTGLGALIFVPHLNKMMPVEPFDLLPAAGIGVRRGYITQQASSRTQLTGYASQFADAHRTVPAANGLSVRFPWKTYDADPGVLPAGYTLASNEHLDFYAVRIMAGRHTPPAKMGRTLTENGTTFPSPFGDNQGNPNTTFLNHMETTMRAWAEFLTSTGEVNPILHWSWYAKEWAEIYHGPAVRAAPGYTKAKFVAAQNAIIDRAAAVQADYPGVVMELPMSGHGPIADIVDDMTRHVGDVFGNDRAAIQANGWSYRGQWGQQDAAVDTQMDACFTIATAQAISVGVQAIQPWGASATYPQYTTAQIAAAFAQADLAGADYIEVYTPSWLSRNNGSRWAAPTNTWLGG